MRQQSSSSKLSQFVLPMNSMSAHSQLKFDNIFDELLQAQMFSGTLSVEVEKCVQRLNEAHKFFNDCMVKVREVLDFVVQKVSEIQSCCTDPISRKNSSDADKSGTSLAKKPKIVFNSSSLSPSSLYGPKKRHDISIENSSNSSLSEQQNSSSIEHQNSPRENYAHTQKIHELGYNKSEANFYYDMLERSVKFPKRVKRDSPVERQGMGSGVWSVEENKRYLAFLETHYDQFCSVKTRRADQVIKALSKFVGTRTASQCSSHHQALQLKHGKIQLIILSLRQQFFGSFDAGPVTFYLRQSRIPFSKPLLTKQQLQRNSHKREFKVRKTRPFPEK